MPGPRKRPTVKDVAAEAGVSVMTVSYAFSRPGRVAEPTRRRVMEAAARLGYRRPDSTARALRSGRTGQVGVVVGEHLTYAFDDPQARRFLAGVAEVCVEEGMGMVLIPTHGDRGRVGAGDASEGDPGSDVDRVLSAPVDAYVLWTTTADDPVLAAVAGSGRPAAIQGGPARSGIACVAPDDRAAARAVASALLAPTTAAAGRTAGEVPVVLSFPLDHDRTPALLRGADLPEDLTSAPFPVTGHRLAGYRDAVLEGGGDWGSTLVAVVARNGRGEGGDAVRAVLDEVDPDAPLLVLAMSDELALGASAALEAAGRSVRCAGWDASPEGRAAGIASVTNPLREQGRRCARLALGSGGGDGEVPWRVVGVDD